MNEKIEVTVTYLEMTVPPRRAAAGAPSDGTRVMRAEKPTGSVYRYLYDTVGEPWLWYERRRMSDAALAAIVQDADVRIDVLYVAGVPAGYAELDFRRKDEVELGYFGLMPEFIGAGYGGYLLDRAIDTAWKTKPERLWVNTCTMDHPRALKVYRRAGFVPYRRTRHIIDDPRKNGLIAPSGHGSGA